jgi:hypothetical protein
MDFISTDWANPSTALNPDGMQFRLTMNLSTIPVDNHVGKSLNRQKSF